MSGVLIIRAKLAAHAPLTAIVPAARIMEGDLPEGTPVPAISITQVDSIPRVTVKGGATYFTERVQVTVFTADAEVDGSSASGYTGLRAILDLVRAACPHTRGTVGGVKCDAIVLDIEGPTLAVANPAMVSRSRDFLVRWSS